MRIGTLIRLLLLMAFVWLVILGVGIFNQQKIEQHASNYLSAEFEITGSNCIGGDRVYDSRTHTYSTRTRYCFWEGLVYIDGENQDVKEEIHIGSEIPSERIPGERIKVFYNPELAAFGANYQNLRVLRAEYGDPGVVAKSWLEAAKKLVLYSLGMIVLVHFFLRFSIWWMHRRPRRGFLVDLGGGIVGLGTLIVSQTLALLTLDFQHLTLGKIIFGLLCTGIGFAFLARKFVQYSSDTATESRGRHLFGFLLPKQKERKTIYSQAEIGISNNQLTVRLIDAKSSLTIPCGKDETTALKIAERIERQLHLPVRKSLSGWHDLIDSETKRSRSLAVKGIFRIALVLALTLLIVSACWQVIAHVPQVRLKTIKLVMNPRGTFRHQPVLRQWTLSQIPDNADKEEILELLRLANVIDGQRFPKITADLFHTLERCTNKDPAGKIIAAPSLSVINRQAAEMLGLSLDANGGVFTWFTVEERFRTIVDTFTSPDPWEAWRAWDHFAAGQLNSSEQFLYAVGPALGDGRPIHFAIKRGSFFGNQSTQSFEGQPEPIAKYSDVIVRTVGEALALQYWYRLEDEKFPEIFSTWWLKWSRDHHFPPLRLEDKQY